MRLCNSWKLNCMDQWRCYNFSHAEEFRNFNITLKYCSIFKNMPLANRVAHIKKDFLTCYSCSYYVHDQMGMKNFCEFSKLSNLMEEPTCYESPEIPSCIDLILTNCSPSFHDSCVETTISDFHKITFSIMKSNFQKLKP